MLHHGEFGEDPSNRCIDMAILLLSRWRRPPCWIFENRNFLQSTEYALSKCVITPNLVKIGRTVAEIRADNRSVAVTH